MSFDQGPPVQKKSKLPLILGILGGGALLVAICCGAFGYFAYSMGTKPMEAATEAMNANPAFTEKLGSPIEWDVNGMNVQANGAIVNAKFVARGPNGTANVEATLDAGQEFAVQSLKAECSDGTTLTLP